MTWAEMLTLTRGSISPLDLTIWPSGCRRASSTWTLVPFWRWVPRRLSRTITARATTTRAAMMNFFKNGSQISRTGSGEGGHEAQLDAQPEQPEGHGDARGRRRGDARRHAIPDDQEDERPDREQIQARQQGHQDLPGALGGQRRQIRQQDAAVLHFVGVDLFQAQDQGEAEQPVDH